MGDPRREALEQGAQLINKASKELEKVVEGKLLQRFTTPPVSKAALEAGAKSIAEALKRYEAQGKERGSIHVQNKSSGQHQR